MIKERPVIFSTDMVKAILDGRKTKTRRVVKPQPRIYEDFMHTGRQAMGITTDSKSSMVLGTKEALKAILAYCPYGQVGDRLWVRETHNIGGIKPNEWAIYKADYLKTFEGILWRPSIHMPRWASRITLEITEVRVERLQEISLRDIEREGISDNRATYNAPIQLEKFTELWDSLNAKRGYGWEVNPWVRVIGFRRLNNAT